MKSSIRVKVFALVACTSVALVTILGITFERWQSKSLRNALQKKAAGYGLLVSRASESGVAFDDVQTVRETFEATATDPDVKNVALYTEEGSLLHALDVDQVDEGPPFSETPHVESYRTFVRAVTPVISKEGPRGVLVVDIGTASLMKARAQSRRVMLVGAAVTLLLALVVAWLVARSMARRIDEVAGVAAKMAGGDLTQPALPESGDEVGRLAHAFNGMVRKVRSLMAEIEQKAAEENARLELLVSERTKLLDRRNDEMRLVLDHVEQGLVMVDQAGKMSRERSAALSKWFGDGKEDDAIWSFVGRVDAGAAAWLEVGWSFAFDDLMPVDVAVEQLPRRARSGGRVIQFAYIPIAAADGGKHDRILVVASDVTDQLALERVEAMHREMGSVFVALTKDKPAFMEFMGEASSIVKRISHPPAAGTPSVLRDVHTLKGNCGVYGIESIAQLCHHAETRFAETGELAESDTRAISLRWTELCEGLHGIVDDAQRRTVDIEVAELERLARALVEGRPRAELVEQTMALTREHARGRLETLANQARAVAERLGHAHVDVVVEPTDARYDAERFRGFFGTFVHLVRNAMDHGVDSEEERLAAGKPARATVRLRAMQHGGMLTIEIADDGRGIDWASVAAKARAAGLRYETRADLESALFADGLSTRAEASELSGRGIGLSAVKRSCEVIGGRVRVQSTRGSGTTFSFEMPLATPTKVVSSSLTNMPRVRESVAPKAN